MVRKYDKNMTTCTYIALIIYIWGGYLLPHVLNLTYIDEIYEIIMLFLLFCYKFKAKEFYIFLSIFLFYLVYGLLFSANPVPEAVIKDCIQELKPFTYIFFGYYFSIRFTPSQKSTLKLNLVIASICVFIDVTFFRNGGSTYFFELPLEIGMICFSYALLYYFLSDRSKKDTIVCCMILVLGLTCTRTKYYGEFLLFMFMLFAIKRKLKVSFKYIVMIGLIVIAIYYIAITKFVFYFIESDTAARSVLYRYMPTMLIDYFPFGTGLGSYASHVSGEFYSPLYYKYGLDGYYGMSPTYYSFIADTYFPVLAEFGILGIILFVWFWYRRIKEILILGDYNLKYYKCGLLIIGMVTIESVAGPVFVMSWGFIPLITLGFICREGRPFVRYRRLTHEKDKNLNVPDCSK